MRWPISVIALQAATAVASAAEWPGFQPPPTRRSDVEEVWHGTTVRDPYRWLEELDGPEVKAWTEAQAAAGRRLLDQLPMRPVFQKRLEELWNYDKHGLPQLVAGRLIYTKKAGLQNQAVHFWRPSGTDPATEKTLLDPNTLSPDGTVSVGGSSVSPDGKFFAYGLSHSGSDWQEWRIIDVDSGATLDDHLKWVKFSGANWAADSSGFYYSRYDEPKGGDELKASNLNQKVFFHRVRTAQSADPLIHARPDQPAWMLGAFETEDGRFVLIEASEGAAARNSWFIANRTGGAIAPIRELLPGFTADHRFVGNDGAELFFLTDFEAPRSRLVAFDPASPTPDKWRTVVPHSSAVLQSVNYVGGKFIAQSMVDAHDEVAVFDPGGTKVAEIPLPNFGAVMGFRGRHLDTEVYYAVSGYTQPAEIFRYDVPHTRSDSWWKTKVPFATDAFVTEQLFYSSKDGTRVPMFVTHRKGIALDGSHPAILYGYGGFNQSLGPTFSPATIAWLEKGGVYAVPNLRGGGEYGEDWHRAGQRLKKQNVFDDFIAAAQFLIDRKFTSSSKLAISGGSNGGLLVAACLLQQPALFAAAAPAVGVHDLLRFQKFTIGWAWQDEYGFPEKDMADFENLRRLSPCHNVREGVAYPPTLVMTADHDDRVFPAHSFKFGAALQAAQARDEAGRMVAPIVLRIETKAGHGAGTPTVKTIALEADRFAFFAQALGMKGE